MVNTDELIPSNAIEFQNFSSIHYASDSVYVTELIKGKRCVAVYDEDESRWRFFSWHTEEICPSIDMGDMDKNYIYDGLISTLNTFKASLALSQYVVGEDVPRPSYNVSEDNSPSVFIVMDILKDYSVSDYPYFARRLMLDKMTNSQLDFKGTSDVYLIPMIERIPVSGTVFEDPMLAIINLFNKVRAEGGDGIILYFNQAPYFHGKTRYVQVLRGVKTASLLIEKVFYKEDEDGKIISSFLCHGTIGDVEVRTKVKAYTMLKRTRREYARTDQMLQGKICEVLYNGFDALTDGSNVYSLQSPRVLGVRSGDEESNKNFIH